MTLAECSELVARIKLGETPVRPLPPQLLPFDFALATRMVAEGEGPASVALLDELSERRPARDSAL